MLPLRRCAVLDDGDAFVAADTYLQLPGEGSRAELSDAELIVLVVTVDAPDAADDDENENGNDTCPQLTAVQVHNMLNDVSHYMQACAGAGRAPARRPEGPARQFFLI